MDKIENNFDLDRNIIHIDSSNIASLSSRQNINRVLWWHISDIRKLDSYRNIFKTYVDILMLSVNLILKVLYLKTDCEIYDISALI